MKEAGETEHSIVELHWINMDILAMLTQDEENNLYIETYFLEGGVSTVCDKMQLCEMDSFETVKVQTDPSRQLFTVFLFNSVSIPLPNFGSASAR